MRIEENDTRLIAYFSGDENAMSYVVWFFCGFLFIDVLDVKRAVIHWDGLLVLIIWLLVVAAVWRVNHFRSMVASFLIGKQECSTRFSPRFGAGKKVSILCLWVTLKGFSLTSCKPLASLGTDITRIGK